MQARQYFVENVPSIDSRRPVWPIVLQHQTSINPAF